MQRLTERDCRIAAEFQKYMRERRRALGGMRLTAAVHNTEEQVPSSSDSGSDDEESGYGATTECAQDLWIERTSEDDEELMGGEYIDESTDPGGVDGSDSEKAFDSDAEEGAGGISGDDSRPNVSREFLFFRRARQEVNYAESSPSNSPEAHS